MQGQKNFGSPRMNLSRIFSKWEMKRIKVDILVSYRWVTHTTQNHWAKTIALKRPTAPAKKTNGLLSRGKLGKLAQTASDPGSG